MKDQLLDLARRQFGVLSREQLMAAGFGRLAINHRLARGEWVVALPGVYRQRAAPMTLQQEAMAALLWAGSGAAISHLTAGVLWGFESLEPRPIHLVCDRASRPPKGIVRHRMQLLDGDVVTHRGLRVTSAARTLIDLASVTSTPVLQKAVDYALNRRLLTFPALAAALAAHSGRGHRGIRRLGKIVSDGPARPQSKLERLFMRLAEKHGFKLVPQFPIDFGPFVGHVDFAIPELKIAIECDGFSYHGGKVAWARDGFRRNQLTLKDWRSLQTTWADIQEYPDLVIAQLRKLVDSSKIVHPVR